jgi:hypothetical protein
LQVAGFGNVSTFRIENTPNVNVFSILDQIQPNSRVRLIGIDKTFTSASEILAFMDKLDTFRGLDENGNNLDKAVVSGVFHVNSLLGDELAEMNARYPNITITYNSISVRIRFYNGETLWNEQTVVSGETITVPTAPTKDSTPQHNYTFKGWSIDGQNVVEIGVAGGENTNYYALFDESLRYYTVRFINGDTVLQTVSVLYMESANYTGEIPIKTGVETPSDYEFLGWQPLPTNVTTDTNCYAQYKFIGVNSAKILQRTISGHYENDRVESVGDYAFYYCVDLVSVNFPLVKSIGERAFQGCSKLERVDLASATNIGSYVFCDCPQLTTFILRNNTMCTLATAGSFNETPIKWKTGYIYVPKSLVDEYKADYEWGMNFGNQIRAIEDYPDICGGDV